ncbi:hypothetical protein BJX65DRAFT_284684 [Aspergillus insuetus]
MPEARGYRRARPKFGLRTKIKTSQWLKKAPRTALQQTSPIWRHRHWTSYAQISEFGLEFDCPDDAARTEYQFNN